MTRPIASVNSGAVATTGATSDTGPRAPASMPAQVATPLPTPTSMNHAMPSGEKRAAVPRVRRSPTVIATDAAISVVTGLIKISMFGLAGVVTAQVLAFALLIGAIAIPGAFLAKAFVERMPVHIHTAILDAAVIVGGIVMITAALRY